MVHAVASKSEFDEALAKNARVLVDFHAVWCGPCKAIAPFVENLSKEFTDVTFLKVDVDEVQETAAEQEVTAMPTFILYKDGKKVDEVVGANPGKLRAAVQGLRS